MDGFDRKLLDRLPLAEAVLLVLGHCWDDSFLDGLFDRYAVRGYTEKIHFATLVGAVRDALIRHGGSANKAFHQAIVEGTLTAQASSAYQKLGRLPIELSVAFLRESTRRLTQLLPAGGITSPPCLRTFDVRAFDGKTLKHVTRRLKPLRAIRGRMLGGKLLVGLDLDSGLALAMGAEPDAFRNDLTLTDILLEQLPVDPRRPAVYLGDRQFCDLRLMGRVVDRGDHFIIRHNHNVHFTPDPLVTPVRGIDSQGRRWTDQIGWLGAAANPRRRRVRRITLARPGQEDVSILTDLTDAHAFPAEPLLDSYLRRWGIEQVFQKVTEVFSLKRLIGTTPNATIFQAAFCFVLYNVTQLIKNYIALAADKPPEQVSTRKLFDDVREQMIGWAVAATSPAASLRALGTIPAPNDLRRRLTRLLSDSWTDWWIKSPTRPRPPTPQPRYAKSGRASVHRVLEEYRSKQRRRKK